MKALPFRIPKTIGESFRVQIDEGTTFYDVLHRHPEIQVTLVLKGDGTVVCGDYLGRFEPDQLYLFGSNQSHVLKCDDKYYKPESVQKVHAISLFFDENSLGEEFFRLPELKSVIELIYASSRGIRYSKQVMAQVKPLMGALQYMEGIERVITFLQVLNILSSTSNFEWLGKGISAKREAESEGKRMNDIFQFTMKEFHRNIKLEEVAALANMTPNAFCRYFKLRTRKTYVNYLNEIRISHACKLLGEADYSVVQVADLSGFNNLSHFSRIFKKIKGLTPGKYAKSLKNKVYKLEER